MEELGYICSGMIGFSLGLLGAGGSILTLPVLVYFFRLHPAEAVRYSLFVVGVTSIGAVIPRVQKKEILFLQGGIFALFSSAMVSLTRRFIIPQIPEQLLIIQGYSVSFGTFCMLVFALLMMLASRTMVIGKESQTNAMHESPGDFKLVGIAIFSGLLTGLLGAGGGFIIIPALMIFFNLDMKKAVGTSLLIISINTLVGFMTDFFRPGINWDFLLKFTFVALTGGIVGQRLSLLVETVRLRRLFGWFIFFMGLTILIAQGYEFFNQNSVSLKNK